MALLTEGGVLRRARPLSVCFFADLLFLTGLVGLVEEEECRVTGLPGELILFRCQPSVMMMLLLTEPNQLAH